MSDLKIIKSKNFGTVQTDIYSNGDELFMTISQLADCLEYSNGRKGIDTLLARHEYLKNDEFSVTLRLRATDGKQYNTRVFTEDGIYEATMLSEQPKAQEFRAWIRKLLKALRKGEVKVVPARPTLSSTNNAAKIIGNTLKEAGMPPQFIALNLQRIYQPMGIDISLDGITTEKKSFDATTIAERIGLFSKSGKPHGHAVSAIISYLNISEDEKVLVPFQNQNSGHSGSTVQYAESVIRKAWLWLKVRGCPTSISYNGKNYALFYRETKIA